MLGSEPDQPPRIRCQSVIYSVSLINGERRAIAGEYWLGEVARAAIAPLLPAVHSGARRKDDRPMISGMIHALRSFCRWQDCPAVRSPSTTVYNRLNRWRRSGRWRADRQNPRRLRPRRSAVRLPPDAGSPRRHHRRQRGCCNAVLAGLPDRRWGYVARQPRQDIAFHGTATAIRSDPTRKQLWPINRETCNQRNLVERRFNRRSDFRRIANRYDKLARNLAFAIALAAIALWRPIESGAQVKG